MLLAGLDGKSSSHLGISELDYWPNRCVVEVIKDDTVEMSYLSKKNSRKGASEMTSALNPDPAKAEGFLSLVYNWVFLFWVLDV